MSRRAQIVMSPEELRAFLDQEFTLTCATIGPGGRPHLMPLWYIREGDVIACWTYGVSQKVKNLERLPQATLQVEAGTKYEELRGVMFECDVEIVRDREAVLDIGVALAHRYGHVPAGAPPELVRAGALKRGAKRVGLRFRPTRTVTWDHRKLGVTY
jgi:PPOX class probable F420-dependent enzyme